MPELACCFQCVSFLVRSWAIVTCTSQAVKDARASQDILIDVFERIEIFFGRLEIYIEVPPTSEMIDILVRIMVEVLSILGIAMKEIKRGRMSKHLLHRYVAVD